MEGLIDFTQFSFQITDPDSRLRFTEMFARFIVHAGILTIISRLVYYKHNQKIEYMFAQIMTGIIVFLLCGLLFWVELQLGLALGLFAIFAIINFRTNTIPVKEMSYLFAIVGISAINGLLHLEHGLLFFLFPNAIVVFAVYSMERVWFTKRTSRRTIIYTNMEFIKPGNSKLLVEDIKKITGLDITRYEIGKVDYIKGQAEIFIYFISEGPGDFSEEQ